MPKKIAKKAPVKTPVLKTVKQEFSIAELARELNSFSVDNYWDLGKFLVEKVMPNARKQGMFEDQVLKMISSQPGIKFPFSILKDCQKYYTYYPDVKKRSLPEVF